MHSDRQTYVPAFDGLRGIAVLPVVLLHVGASVLPDSALLRALTRGWYGVDLFFVLSGFLITKILVRELDATGTIAVGRFYYRRFLRLMPAYVTMLTAVLAGAAVFAPDQLRRVPVVLPSLLTGTYNYEVAAGAPHFGVLVVIWSLCVEAQFYLLWPWLLRGVERRRLMRLCVLAIILLSVYRTVLYAVLNWGHLRRPTPFSATWIYFATDTRIAVILIGCAAALSVTESRIARIWFAISRRRGFAWLALAAAVVCIMFVTGGAPSSASWRSATFGYTLAGAASAVLLIAVFLQPESGVARLLSLRPLVSLGTVSYGVYLFHLPIARLLLIVCPRTAWPQAALASTAVTRYFAASAAVLALTWLLAAMHYKLVEQRVLRLRPAIKPAAGRAIGMEQRQPAGSRFPAQAL